MASSPEETADSRTSGVGRKRTLRETSSPYENNNSDSSDEESAQQSYKRVKPNQEDLQDEPSFVEQVPNDIIPAVADTSSSDLPEISSLSTPTEQVEPPSTSWNQGVQGGLRTSFARKKITRRPSIPLVMEEGEVEEQPTSLVGKETLVMPQSGGQDPSREPINMAEADPDPSSDEMDRMIANEIVESEGPGTMGDIKRSRSHNRVLDENDRPLSKKQTQKYHALFKQFEAEDKGNGHKRSLEQLRAQALALVGTSNVPRTITPVNNDTAGQITINLPDIIRGYYTNKSRSIEYLKSGVTWHICEIANTGNKKPIQLGQFNYRIFAASFLSDNVDQFCSLSRELRQQPKLFVKALSLYTERFFSKDLLQKRNKLRSDVKSEAGQKWLRTLLNKLPEQKQALQNMFTTAPASSVTPGSSSKPVPIPGQTSKRDLGPSDTELLEITTTSAVEAEAAKSNMEDAENLDEPTKADNAEHETNNDTGYSGTGTNATSPMETASEVMDINAELLDDAEVELQVKYFPTPKGEPVLQRCIACAASGHTSAHCPAMRCFKCGIVGLHSTLSCPQNQRCSKCRQRGHQLAECPEKLYVSKAEADPCDLCESKEHLEVACPLIWRSFDLKPEEIRRVRDIPIHCYCCGGSGHFGPECGLSNHRALSGNRTWSSANWKQYIDYNSKERAISAGVDYSLPPKTGKGFSIKGKANNPIELDDSDDDETSFIRPKVNVGSQERGNIRFGAYGNDNYAPVDSVSSSGRGRYQPDPPRTSRAAPMNNYDSYQPRDDSARYGRERTFSPPPRYNSAARFDSQQQRNPPDGGFSRHDQASPVVSNGFGDGGRAVRGGSRGRGRSGNTAPRTGNRPNPVEDKPKRARPARKPRAAKADRYKSK